MTLTDLGIVYALGGVVSAVWIRRRSAPKKPVAAAALLLAFLLWPLWLPISLSSAKPVMSAAPGVLTDTEAALLEGHRAVEGTALEALLPRDALARMQQEVRRAAARCAELDAVLSDKSFDRGAARERIARLEREGASPRALASARSHSENIERLHALRDRDRGALNELSELAHALRTQLVLARYAGSSPADASDIVSEVWARLEALDTTFDGSTFSTTFPDAAG